MGRRRSVGFGNKPIGGPVEVKSRRVARKLTSAYHSIRNEVYQIDRRLAAAVVASPPSLSSISSSSSSFSKVKEKSVDKIAMSAVELACYRRRKEELMATLEENGGVGLYQLASVVSTKHFKTSRFIVRTLQKELKRIPPSPEAGRLRTLEVGAINTQLQECPHLQVRAIDVNSQHSRIEEMDFFDLEDATMGSFDVVVASMVINCVECPYKRFEMLVRLVLQLAHGGTLFVMLPVRCVESKHLHGAFVPLLRALGLGDCIPHHRTPKVAFYVLKRESGEEAGGRIGEGAARVQNFMKAAIARLDPNLVKHLSEPAIFDMPPTEFCMSLIPPP